MVDTENIMFKIAEMIDAIYFLDVTLCRPVYCLVDV
jgi:hypothetical protein